MRDDIDKLLVYLGRITVQNPALQMIVGFLLSNVGRVRFVDSLEGGSEWQMAISAHRRIELPISPWQGYVRGVPVPDALTWIQSARTSSDHIDIRLSSDDLRLRQLLAPLMTSERARHERLVMDGRMKNLRQELDRALDLYNEVRHLMEIDQDRHQELEKFLSMAEREMQNMGRELSHLKERMDGDSPKS